MFKIIDKEKILNDTIFSNEYELRDFLNKCCNYRGYELNKEELKKIKELIPRMTVDELKEELLLFNFQVKELINNHQVSHYN